MYAHFKGKIENIYNDRIVIDVNNIGYEIYMPESQISSMQEGMETKIYTYLNVREDEMRLFGFNSYENLEFFKKLISVSGVGPKVALGIISNVNASDICVAIATDNVATLKKIPGIGPKMAQKIIFELKDKVVKDQILQTENKISKISKNNNNINEAITALEVLGYSQKEINEVLSSIQLIDDSVEGIIKEILKHMQKI